MAFIALLIWDMKMGPQTGHLFFWEQCFQWAMICWEAKQCSAEHSDPSEHSLMCLIISLVDLQYGRVHSVITSSLS